MKYIADSGFSQGLHNPLKTASGDKHIPRGAVIDLDDTQLRDKDVIHLIAIKRLIPLDSPKGKEVFVQEQKVSEKAATQAKRDAEAQKPRTNWERLGVLIALAALFALVLTYLFK